MENLAGNLIVKSIIFESNDEEVLVKGKMEKWGLLYDGELVISHSQLNRLMCEMNKKSKHTVSLNEVFESEQVGPDEIVYFADFETSHKISMSIFKTGQEIRQIRA